jgi:hypothetical protein
VSLNRSRRQFLQAGIALPVAAGLVSSTSLDSAFQSSPELVYRTLGKTGLKVTGVGYGIGFVPIPESFRGLLIGALIITKPRVIMAIAKIFSPA